MMPVFLLALLLALPVVAETDGGTGLVRESGFEAVSVHCTVCHSARLITQNRANREGWLAMIRWMQATQGLWPLGDQESLILDYLATNYSARPSGRRRPLPPSLLPPTTD